MTATVRGIKAEGREGARSVDGNEYQVTYVVQVDSRSDGPRTAMLAFGIPDIGQIYQAGNDLESGAIVTGKTCAQVSPWVYEVTVNYSTDIGDVDVSTIGQSVENPLLDPPEVSYGFQERRILIPGRYNDPMGPPGDNAWQAGIFAPNGELFDPQPEMDISEPVLSIKRNVQTFQPAALMALANSVNSDFWQGASPRQLKLKAPQANRKYHNVVGFYWEISYSIAYRWETWDVQVLNQGHYYFSGGKPTSVWSTTARRLVKTDDVGNPIVVNLTTNGDINTSSTPTFTRLRVFREVAFSSLGIL